MQPEIIIAVLSLAGTLAGSLLGAAASYRLTSYRLDQLERKMEKHNDLIERMVVVEQAVKAVHSRIDSIR